MEEVVWTFQRLSKARAASAAIEAEYRDARATVLALVREQLNAVDEEFAGRVKETADEAVAAEQAVRQLVLRLGRGVRLAGIRAAYYPGRVTWDTHRLDEYALDHPDVSAFRKVGKAWVNLRFLDSAVPAESRPASPGLTEASGNENDETRSLPAWDGG